MTDLTTESWFLLWNGFFFTLLLFCAFVAFAQWRLSNDKAILWYLGYLASNFGFYLWQCGKDWTKSGIDSGFLLELDTPLSYLSSACYLMFIWTVFEVKIVAPKLSWFFLWAVRFYAAMFGVNLLLQLFTSYEIWINIHRLVRLLLFPYMVWLVWYFMFRGSRFFYERLILIGTLAVLVGVITAIFVRGSHPAGVLGVHDFMHLISTPWDPIYVPDVKLCIAIDVILFSWAITLRQKMLLQRLVPPTPPVFILPLAPPPADDAFLSKTDAFLRQNFQRETLATKDLAAALFLSEGQVNRKMKEKTGLTTEQHILRYRLDRALHLLLTTAEPVGAIARDVGLKDIAHFSHAFKKQYGLSPSDIRKKGRENAGKGQEDAG
ncbi:MAG: helix-turn-helix domain-containing protein [Saprospiraceae bacterium]